MNNVAQYRYRILGIFIVLTWIIGTTYLIQSNTPKSDQGYDRTPASTGNTDNSGEQQKRYGDKVLTPN